MKLYNNHKDDKDDEDDATYSMSKMSLKHGQCTYDTTDAYSQLGEKSVTFSTVDSVYKRERHKTKNTGSLFKCTLPYLVDYWTDIQSKQRASIQLQMLSASNDVL